MDFLQSLTFPHNGCTVRQGALQIPVSEILWLFQSPMARSSSLTAGIVRIDQYYVFHGLPASQSRRAVNALNGKVITVWVYFALGRVQRPYVYSGISEAACAYISVRHWQTWDEILKNTIGTEAVKWCEENTIHQISFFLSFPNQYPTRIGHRPAVVKWIDRLPHLKYQWFQTQLCRSPLWLSAISFCPAFPHLAQWDLVWLHFPTGFRVMVAGFPLLLAMIHGCSWVEHVIKMSFLPSVLKSRSSWWVKMTNR